MTEKAYAPINVRTEIMVGVVQSVEHQIVILGVVGSSPIIHPIFRNIYASENLRKKSIILSPGLTFWGFFLSKILGLQLILKKMVE